MKSAVRLESSHLKFDVLLVLKHGLRNAIQASIILQPRTGQTEHQKRLRKKGATLRPRCRFQDGCWPGIQQFSSQELALVECSLQQSHSIVQQSSCLRVCWTPEMIQVAMNISTNQLCEERGTSFCSQQTNFQVPATPAMSLLPAAQAQAGWWAPVTNSSRSTTREDDHRVRGQALDKTRGGATSKIQNGSFWVVPK